MCWKISFSFIKIQEELCSNFAELVETERATNKNVKRRRGAKKKKVRGSLPSSESRCPRVPSHRTHFPSRMSPA